MSAIATNFNEFEIVDLNDSDLHLVSGGNPVVVAVAAAAGPAVVVAAVIVGTVFVAGVIAGILE